ncbi:hypothetical protein AQUCO_00300032v1 [Aquilegia coerulea]|uniref:Cytochrome P450 n=1 Tax=Aquilegia coerulea TaxID=218851 RepID=A0A2G5EWX9_AQUCA|nr:hypothetical protein AQUCO_00300032v1 [Aquilegia coerulea]
MLLFFFLALAWIWSKNYSKRLPPSPLALPILGHLYFWFWPDFLPRTLLKLSKKYGLMYLRIGAVPIIVVSSPDITELLMKTQDPAIACKPTAQISKYMFYGGKGIASAKYYEPYWRVGRKVSIIHLLANSKFDLFKPVRRYEVGHLIAFLKKEPEDRQVVDISSKVTLLIENIIYKMIFGGRNISKSLKFKKTWREGMRLGAAFNLAGYMPYIGAFDLQVQLHICAIICSNQPCFFRLTCRWKDLSTVIDEYLEKIINEVEQETTETKEHFRSFINVLISLMKSDNTNEEKLDRDQVKAIILELIVASIDTTVATIEWTLSELLRNPLVLKRVQEELANVIGLDCQQVEEIDLAKLDYLEKVMKESLRLHPVAGIILRKATEDISIKNFNIPKKMLFVVNSWALGRDPAVWPEKTEEFYPERFINIDIDIRGRDKKLLPFGAGRKRCPGMEPGLRITKLVLAQLVHCFDWELPDGMSPRDLDMKEKLGITVSRANPLLAVPTFFFL